MEVRPECLVLGLGGVGSAALYQLARRGVRVLGVEQFELVHDRGSSHGESRVIRKAYFEHPDYVPLMQNAYQAWSRLEVESQQRLFDRVGLLQVGPPEGTVLRGVRDSAAQHHLPTQPMTRNEVARRYPWFRLPADHAAVFEPDAGLLHVERCVRTQLELAQSHGAQVIAARGTASVQIDTDRIVVHVDGITFQPQRLILTVGPWAAELLADVTSFQVLRKHAYWYAANDSCWHLQSGCPTFLYELPHGVYYGFPSLNGTEIKVAEHSGGMPLTAVPTLPDQPDTLEERRVTEFVRDQLGFVAPRATRQSRCFYTMSQDEHFVVDVHPRNQHVVLAAGLSGHGFKFAPVLGEALADLALAGGTDLPVDFLRLRRFNTITHDHSRLD